MGSERKNAQDYEGEGNKDARFDSASKKEEKEKRSKLKMRRCDRGGGGMRKEKVMGDARLQKQRRTEKGKRRKAVTRKREGKWKEECSAILGSTGLLEGKENNWV